MKNKKKWTFSENELLKYNSFSKSSLFRDVCMYIQENEANEIMNDFFEEFQLGNCEIRYN